MYDEEDGEYDLQHEMEELRKLNVQMAKHLVDSLNELKRLRKRIDVLETQVRQGNIPF